MKVRIVQEWDRYYLERVNPIWIDRLFYWKWKKIYNTFSRTEKEVEDLIELLKNWNMIIEGNYLEEKTEKTILSTYDINA